MWWWTHRVQWGLPLRRERRGVVQGTRKVPKQAGPAEGQGGVKRPQPIGALLEQEGSMHQRRIRRRQLNAKLEGGRWQLTPALHPQLDDGRVLEGKMGTT